MDEKMGHSVDDRVSPRTGVFGTNRYLVLGVVLCTAAIYIGCMGSPPSLMDDVDAVQAQIAQNMLSSGDWVTARLDGVVYLEKAPLVYWAMAVSYKVFGVHDWTARIPITLAAIALAWITALFGKWAFGEIAGFYAGLCMASGIGLFLFTRILIPDVILTLTTALAMWSFLRALDEHEMHPRLWAFLFAASLGIGLLLKSLIGVYFPVASALIYLLLTHQFFSLRTWKKLHVLSGFLVILAIAAPWHVLATRRNPPYFVFTLHSGPGQYHGFLWFFFINEQLLRFLNLRYPRDYDTVPVVLFWLLTLVWLFPWSVYLPATLKLSFKPADRAGRTRLLALCWAAVVLVFFTFSTTQEYYSMPCYPALALLIGSAMASDNLWIRRGTLVLAVISACAVAVMAVIYLNVRNLPTPGDIASALSRHPNAYRLSMGHMLDLTFESFAYLRKPLLLATAACLVGTIATIRATTLRASVAVAIMMILFFQAARLALVVFDPYLSSRSLADALSHAPDGQLIENGQYYHFSSVVFYTNRTALLLNGKVQNLEYGAFAPNAPSVFIEDSQFQQIWASSNRYYLLSAESGIARLGMLAGPTNLIVVARSGGKVLLTNHPFSNENLSGLMNYSNNLLLRQGSRGATSSSCPRPASFCVGNVEGVVVPSGSLKETR
jgi:4-amino-4-deoxy-L-arabinose transferase-like glycosyltransferase